MRKLLVLITVIVFTAILQAFCQTVFKIPEGAPDFVSALYRGIWYGPSQGIFWGAIYWAVFDVDVVGVITKKIQKFF